MKSVPEMLREAAKTFEERNTMYGNNYKSFGMIMFSLFPTGIHARTIEDFNRLAVLILMVLKLARYCHQFKSGGHDDSLLDLAVYSQMLRELDHLKDEA